MLPSYSSLVETDQETDPDIVNFPKLQREWATAVLVAAN
jgi:hypothetical protein